MNNEERSDISGLRCIKNLFAVLLAVALVTVFCMPGVAWAEQLSVGQSGIELGAAQDDGQSYHVKASDYDYDYDYDDNYDYDSDYDGDSDSGSDYDYDYDYDDDYDDDYDYDYDYDIDVKEIGPYTMFAGTSISIDTLQYFNTLEYDELDDVRSSNPGVVKVDNDYDYDDYDDEYNLVALTPGTAVISYTDDESVEYRCTVNVKACTIKSVGSAKQTIDLGKTKTMNVAAAKGSLTKDDFKHSLQNTVKWKTSDKSVATVDKNGVVKAKGAGKATITASAPCSNSVKWTITVPKVQAKNVKIAALKNKEYTGRNIKPNIAATCNGTKLKKGTDYTLSYKANKDIGKALVYVTFKGKYTGKVTKSFKIVAPKVGKPAITSYSGGSNRAEITWKRGSNATGVQLHIEGGGGVPYDGVFSSSSGSGYCNKVVYGSKAVFSVRSYKVVAGRWFYSGWVKMTL